MLSAEPASIQYVATNFATNIKGDPWFSTGGVNVPVQPWFIEGVNDVWGLNGAEYMEVKFNVPAGKILTIYTIQGSTHAYWPGTGTRRGMALTSSTTSGFLVGIQETQNNPGSPNCVLCGSQVLVYDQDAIKNEPKRIEIKTRFKGGYKVEGGSLWIKHATFLNESEAALHQETSLVIGFLFTVAQ